MAEINAVTIEEFRDEYEQVRTPDFAAIASYVNMAKGPERSMAQFAEVTGIGASTLSRIVNGRSAKPLSKENIIKIYECRATQEDTFLLDTLARANGMFPKEYADRVKARDRFAARRNEEISRERMMKTALIAGIVGCGMPVSEVVNTPLYRSSVCPAYLPRRRGDFVLMLGADENDPGIKKTWTFFLFPTIFDEAEVERHRSVRSIVRDIIDRLNGWFVLDAWDSDFLRGDKFSFAFIDEGIFQEFVDALQSAKLHTEMTAILMNPTDYTVEKEVWLPGQYEQLTNISVFQVPMPGEGFIYNDEEDSE